MNCHFASIDSGAFLIFIIKYQQFSAKKPLFFLRILHWFTQVMTQVTEKNFKQAKSEPA